MPPPPPLAPHWRRRRRHSAPCRLGADMRGRFHPRPRCRCRCRCRRPRLPACRRACRWPQMRLRRLGFCPAATARKAHHAAAWFPRLWSRRARRRRSAAASSTSRCFSPGRWTTSLRPSRRRPRRPPQRLRRRLGAPLATPRCARCATSRRSSGSPPLRQAAAWSSASQRPARRWARRSQNPRRRPALGRCACRCPRCCRDLQLQSRGAGMRPRPRALPAAPPRPRCATSRRNKQTMPASAGLHLRHRRSCAAALRSRALRCLHRRPPPYNLRRAGRRD